MKTARQELQEIRFQSRYERITDDLYSDRRGLYTPVSRISEKTRAQMAQYPHLKPRGGMVRIIDNEGMPTFETRKQAIAQSSIGGGALGALTGMVAGAVSSGRVGRPALAGGIAGAVGGAAIGANRLLAQERISPKHKVMIDPNTGRPVRFSAREELHSIIEFATGRSAKAIRGMLKRSGMHEARANKYAREYIGNDLNHDALRYMAEYHHNPSRALFKVKTAQHYFPKGKRMGTDEALWKADHAMVANPENATSIKREILKKTKGNERMRKAEADRIRKEYRGVGLSARDELNSIIEFAGGRYRQREENPGRQWGRGALIGGAAGAGAGATIGASSIRSLVNEAGPEGAQAVDDLAKSKGVKGVAGKAIKTISAGGWKGRAVAAGIGIPGWAAAGALVGGMFKKKPRDQY